MPLALIANDALPPSATRPLDADGQLLERVFRQHGQLVLDTAFRLTGSVSDAEDVLQDVFLALPSALERYEDRQAFVPWLRRVTVRVALMRLRRERGRREVAIDTIVEPRDPREQDTGERAEIERVIAALPTSLRTVFVLREVEGYTHAEIATLLDIREGTSQVRHHRAVRLLRTALGESR
ncbi:MAG: sigma-70 family RNA polymerase sigma factor [bacterium]